MTDKWAFDPGLAGERSNVEECLELLPHRKTPKEGKHPLPLSGLCLPLCEAVLVPGPAEAFLR